MAIRVSSVYKYKRFGDEACLVYDDDKKIYSRDSMMLALSSMAYKAFCDIYDSTN